MYERATHGISNCKQGRTKIVAERLNGSKTKSTAKKAVAKVQSPKACGDCGSK